MVAQCKGLKRKMQPRQRKGSARMAGQGVAQSICARRGVKRRWSDSSDAASNARMTNARSWTGACRFKPICAGRIHRSFVHDARMTTRCILPCIRSFSDEHGEWSTLRRWSRVNASIRQCSMALPPQVPSCVTSYRSLTTNHCYLDYRFSAVPVHLCHSSSSKQTSPDESVYGQNCIESWR